MNVEYDDTVDAADATFGDAAAVFTRVVDGCRLVDFDDSGRIVSLEFLRASRGIRLEGLPLEINGIDRNELARQLRIAGLPVMDDVTTVGLSTLPRTMAFSAAQMESLQLFTSNALSVRDTDTHSNQAGHQSLRMN